MSSVVEVELGALYLHAREAVSLRQILSELGHPQPRTPIQRDNSTADGVINNKIQPKRTKAMDMRFHWLRDREAQGSFGYIGGRGRPTSQTILPNTTLPCTMLMSGQNS